MCLLISVVHSCVDILDLSQIYEFADSLTQSLMADVRNSLRLVIPDYFGFNVVHYDPVREEQGGRDHAPVRERGSGDSAMDTAEMHGAHTQGRYCIVLLKFNPAPTIK